MSDKKEKKTPTKTTSTAVVSTTPAKGHREKLESVLKLPMMHMLDSYTEEELMPLFERVKEMHDVLRTRTLLLPREMRISSEQKEFLKDAMAQLAKTPNGVVEDGEDEEDEEDADLMMDDIDQIDSESDEEEENEAIKKYTDLFKKRLVLVDLWERENTHDEADLGLDELDMDLDEDGESFEEPSEESEEEVKPKKQIAAGKKEEIAKANKKASKMEVEEASDEEASEEDEEDEEDDELEEPGYAMERAFEVEFALLGADGKVAVKNLYLTSSDLYTGETGFEGQHHLEWNDEIVFSLNVQDGDIVEPHGPSMEEIAQMMEEADELDEEDFPETGMPNTWEPETADALKTAAGFPEELTPLQFMVIMLRVMTRIIKNACKTPGPGPADGLLPYLALELANHVEEQDELEEGDEISGEEDDEEDEESSEEEKPVVKKEKKAVESKPQQKESKPQQKESKPQQKESKPQQKESKPQQQQPAKGGDKKPHGDHKPHQHGGDKKSHGDHKPQHNNNKHGNNNQQQGKPQHNKQSPHKEHQHGGKPHHGGDHKKGGDFKKHDNQNNQNNKKRPQPTGGRDDKPGQFKKHKH